ncbi:MAG: hypothetical protein HPY65_05730 [Syntrophaceae bacterium]|nr:hypothetical protein [Syntrophaceae bacterium]
MLKRMSDSRKNGSAKEAVAPAAQAVRPALRGLLAAMAADCKDCNLCVEECGFLEKYGTPGEIARRYDPSSAEGQILPFECSLCSLCDAVCPAGLAPRNLFMEMRRESADRGKGAFPEHEGLLAYERRGMSRRFTWYGLPEGCRAVLFPGCALPGTRPERTWELFETLRGNEPSLGIVLDCCGRISGDLGREAQCTAMFSEMRDWLLERGVREVLVACPNCHDMFREHGGGLAVRTVYEVLPVAEPPAMASNSGVLVHDPCGIRFHGAAHDAVRRLVAGAGIRPADMEHARERTLCCGNGAGADCLSPELSGRWAGRAAAEIGNRTAVTYCAGCAGRLGERSPAVHVLDVLREPEQALAGKIRIAKAPFTYLNRLRLKNRFRKELPVAASRERTFRAAPEKKGGWALRLLLLAVLVGAIAAIRLTGATRYLDQDALRGLIAGYGILAPALYMLIYTVAPALLLPGLPLTIAGGILFGPFWGVVYTITSATAGACLAFLVARYLARDWVEKKLRSPRWRRLDEGVERHGWKVVAFTRLIPLFPFNLLNYAFGMTKIRFWPYAVATFLCMLPATVAYIVFSSSLLDLIRGKVSTTLVVGIGLVVLVSLIPVFWRRWQAGRGGRDPL